MAVKKIKLTLLTAIFITLSLFLFSDISQYKQIGDTNFYLLPDDIGNESFLYHDGGNKGVFYPIYHNGIVHDVYWNQQFIIIKCTQQKKENWYIIKNINDYDYSQFNVQHFVNANDYHSALDSLKISEIKMEHTDGVIPWSLHIWK